MAEDIVLRHPFLMCSHHSDHEEGIWRLAHPGQDSGLPRAVFIPGIASIVEIVSPHDCGEGDDTSRVQWLPYERVLIEHVSRSHIRVLISLLGINVDNQNRRVYTSEE
jgi:hypothetical protein